MYLVIYKQQNLFGVLFTVVKECNCSSDVEEILKEAPVPMAEIKVFEVVPKEVKFDIRLSN